MPENCIGIIIIIFLRFQLNINLRMYRMKPCEVKKEQILWKTSESCTVIGLQRAGDHTSSHQPMWTDLIEYMWHYNRKCKWVMTKKCS